MIIKHRRINKKGGITLTKDIRALAGLVGGEGMDVVVNDDKSITIKKHVPSCQHCGTAVKVASVMGIEICYACASAMKGATENA